jgi:Zn-dependent peptidase ImmA (M78 family)
MAVDVHPLVARLLDRQRAMGATLDELVSWSGLDRGRISELEAGREPSIDEFEGLSRGLAVDSASVYAGEDSDPRRTVARFRAAAGGQTAVTAKDLRALALAAEEGRVLAYLLRLLGRDVSLEPHREVLALGNAEPWAEGYSLGEGARQRLLGTSDPLLDLERSMNELGIHVGRVSFSNRDIDAASIWEPGAAPVILLNRGSRRVDYCLSRRAILSHELCHLLHDAKDDGRMTTRLSWATQADDGYGSAIEARARGFAPAFLAPRPAVRSWYDRLPGSVRREGEGVVGALANYWGLSFEGAAWHAKNCGLIAGDAAEQLVRRSPSWQGVGDRFEMSLPWAPPQMIDPRLPSSAAEIWEGWATELVLEAFSEGVISVGRARELLTWM